MSGRRGTLKLIGALATCAIAGCEQGPGGTPTAGTSSALLDVDWLRENLIQGNVEPRLRYGLLPDGFYQPNLGPDWAPKPPQTATLISQSRIIYVMAMGYEASGEPRYFDAMKRAADYLLTHFRDARAPGRWMRAISPDGKVANGSYHAYGHAHVIFALAHAFAVSQDSRYLDAAMHTWLAVDVPSAIAGKNALYDLRGLNVAMHTFEALLVLSRAADSRLVRGELRSLGDYIIARFYDRQRGDFAESLTSELTRQSSGEVRLGHSIEMAFLLSRAVDAGLPSAYLAPADAAVGRVASVAAADPRGIIPHTVDYAGKVRDGEYYWWCQTELLRGLAHFGVHRQRDDLRTQFRRTMQSVRTLYVDPVDGSWYGKPRATGENRGHEWKVGYHVAMMATEVMRLSGVRLRSGSELPL